MLVWSAVTHFVANCRSFTSPPFFKPYPPKQVDIEDADDAERALTLSNPVLESLEK